MDVPRIPGYEVLGRIGVGSSAQVWRARRVADDLDVALKVVPSRAEDVSAALREAGTLARVRHKHLIHLYDVLPVPGTGGRPAGVALAMELADGGSLGQVLAARDHLTPGELVTVCSPLAGALAELHRAGVVHGDIAPGNVLFRSDGMPLLADLGVSRIAGEVRGETWGTDGMVAPEVLEGFPPSAESDVYGMGALAWRALVGEVPGWVGTRAELAELMPDLPEQLVALVTSCLAPEPADRPEAEELAVALFACARPEPVELAPGADPAAGLTQRIRAEVRAQDGDAWDDHERGEHELAVDDLGLDELGLDELGVTAERAPGGGPGRGGGRARATHARALHRARSGRPTRRLTLRPWMAWAAGGAVACALLVLLAIPLIGLLGSTSASEESADGDRGALAVGSAEASGAEVDPAGPPMGSSDGASSPESGLTGTGTGTGGDGVDDAGVDDAALTAVTPDGPGPDPVAPDGPGLDPAAPDGPGLDPAAEPEIAVQQLLNARAAAWQSGDPRDLTAAHAPGSPALAQEQVSLEVAHEHEVSYRGLRFTVERAVVLEEEADRVVLQVGVERSPYDEVNPSGSEPHPARVDVVELELRREADVWRIWGWG